MELRRHIESGKLVNIKATLCLPKEHLIVKLALHDLIDLIFLEPFDALAFLP